MLTVQIVLYIHNIEDSLYVKTLKLHDKMVLSKLVS